MRSGRGARLAFVLGVSAVTAAGALIASCGESERFVAPGDEEQLPDPVIPAHPERHRFVGEWRAQGEAVYFILEDDAGHARIVPASNTRAGSEWRSVINNVRFVGDALHFDEYHYYTGSENYTTRRNPGGQHPFNGVRNVSTLSLTDDPDRLVHTVDTRDLPEPVSGYLYRAEGGG